jgi:hypothetical protein
MYKCTVMICLTFDHSKQKAQIKCFTTRDRNRAHVSNGLVSLMNRPNSSYLVPNEILGEILIEMIVSSSFDKLRILIGFEPSKQLSVLDIVEYILNFLFGLENHRLMTRKMDRRTINSWPLHVHREFEDIVAGLGGQYISGIKIGVYFILTFHENSGTIWTLVYILVDVIDGLDRSTDLQVDETTNYSLRALEFK